jgi:molecular chaperone DnaK
MDKLNEVFAAASQDMYNASNADGAGAGDAGADQGSGAAHDEVTDVDFEEVKDK